MTEEGSKARNVDGLVFDRLPLLCFRWSAAAILCRGADRRDDPQPDQPGRSATCGAFSERRQTAADLSGALLRRYLWRRVVPELKPGTRLVREWQALAAVNPSSATAMVDRAREAMIEEIR